MPTESQVAQAICCPHGCDAQHVEAGSFKTCMAGTWKDATRAVMELYKPRVVQRRPFVIEDEP